MPEAVCDHLEVNRVEVEAGSTLVAPAVQYNSDGPGQPCETRPDARCMERLVELAPSIPRI